MRSAVRQTIQSILTVEWAQFDGRAALRCTVGVAVPLLIGLAIDQPLVGVFGAAGAVGVGFGSFQGAYRSRAAIMLFAAVAMALSVFIGSLAGHSNAASIVVAAFWAFGGALLVALGRGASFVGLQSIVAVLIAGGYPSDLAGAIGRAALVFCGGLVQTFLVVMVWPLRRFTFERRSLAAVYRTLAAYASTLPARQAVPPEPHTFAGTPSPLTDPQPFAGSDRIFVFQTLLDEAERIRASLAALAVRILRLNEADQVGATALARLVAQALAEIAAALEEGREPREPARLSHAAAGPVGEPPDIAVERLLGQISAAGRTAGMLTIASGPIAPRREQTARRRRLPAIRDALVTLRANLTIRSTPFRHALRLGVILTLAAAGAGAFEFQRGYWVPMTIALVLKPDFHDTLMFGIARTAGTVLGAAGATAIALAFAPGPVALIVLVLAFVWGGYGLRVANYGAFAVCFAGYVVFLMSLAGIPEITAAADRIIYTAIGGALALSAYMAWPTWTATRARPAIAEMLEAQGVYLRALLEAYASRTGADNDRLDDLRKAGRLARSNAEAVVERMLTEPRPIYTMSRHVAVGIVGATHRNALAALSLHAGLEDDDRDALPGIGDLAAQVGQSLRSLAAAVRENTVPPPLPLLRQTQRPLTAASGDLVSDETDLIVDSIETIADLLAKDVPVTASSVHAPARPM